MRFDVGRGDSSRRAIVLLHGFLGEPADWDEVVAHLAADRPIARVDLTQHGQSSASLASLAAALASRLQSTIARPVDLVGYSLGGRVALECCCAFPSLVHRVLCLSTSPGISDPAERVSRAAADDTLATSLEREGLASFLERWYAQPLFASLRSHASYERVIRRRAAGDPHVWAAILRDASPGRSTARWEMLESLASRLSFAVGSLDAKYLALARQAAQRAPSLRVDVVDDAGHALHLEQPEAVAALIATQLGDRLR